MRWYQSLFFKISLIFFIAFASLVGVGTQFTLHQEREQLFEMRRFAQTLLRNAYIPRSGTFDTALLAQEGFVPTDALAPTVFKLSAPPSHHRSNEARRGMFPVDMIKHDGAVYAVAYLREGGVAVFATPFHTSTLLHVTLFGALGFALLALYLLTLRTIRPLVPLKEHIEALAKGDYIVSSAIKSKDEIGAVANAFYHTVEKIKDLKEARQLFLRNIMHEFKTPITKGKLSVELLEDSPYKQKLITVFKRQEQLLEEFSRIEKLGAGEITLHKAHYALEDLLAQALELLEEKSSNVVLQIQPQQLTVDFNLFSVALKNLIDNGINYGTDVTVWVQAQENKLFIINTGKPLEHPLERYKEPYFLEGKKQKESRGLGFGLFIALHVFCLHGFSCSYEHREEKSIFCITFS